MQKRQYIAIDLKSFYASVECVERGMDPLDTCLVVADASRTEKTICLAVSPPLKAYGTGGRPRLFEVVQKVREVNRCRGRQGKSYSKTVLDRNREKEVDFLIAPPRMARYIEYSDRIYGIYLRFVSPDDLHIYSIDEVFMDVTEYLPKYKMSAHELAMTIIRTVLKETGITATAGIGTNMYLCKIAMDIVAKKMPADKDGVRIAELDEMSYRRELWEHKPLTDFWRVGHGTMVKLADYGVETMGDLARCSLTNRDFLYKLFGVNAELIIDHAWGWEPVTIAQVKEYNPETKSICNGQVLHCPYTAEQAKNVILEMADAVSLELLDKKLLTDQLVITVGYDVESLRNPDITARYHGRTTTDHYGRKVPAHSHGTINLDRPTCGADILISKTAELYDRIINRDLLVRRLTLTINRVMREENGHGSPRAVQLDLFSDYDEIKRQQEREMSARETERRRQETVLKIKKLFGKNSILKGLNYSDGATQRDRNRQIGGHRE